MDTINISMDLAGRILNLLSRNLGVNQEWIEGMEEELAKAYFDKLQETGK